MSFTFFASAQEARTVESQRVLENVQAKVMRFYPNPATSVINFEFIKPVNNNLTLQVFNFVGKKVYELNTVSQKTTVPLTEFYRGVYIFQLRDKTGRIVESGKFQVAK
jgi:hypothetical protein